MITYWDQLINNYIDDNYRSGEVCFKKGGVTKKNKAKYSKTINWQGTWTYKKADSSKYQIKIEGKYRGMNLCTFIAKNNDATSYKLTCRGNDKGETFELYYRSVKEGHFRFDHNININKPFLTLKQENDEIVTKWNQLSKRF